MLASIGSQLGTDLFPDLFPPDSFQWCIGYDAIAKNQTKDEISQGTNKRNSSLML
jgi:hypothetical protein